MDNTQYRLEDSNGSVVGFGFTEHNRVSNILLESHLTIKSGCDCAENAEGRYNLGSKMFCAGGEPGVSPCLGDSGGGFVIEINGTFYLRGLVSFSAKGQDTPCDTSKYTVFTNVYKYRAWIARFITRRTWPNTLQKCGHDSFNEQSVCNDTELHEHSFLLLGQKKGITLLSFVTGIELKVANTAGLLDLDFDCTSGRLYWTEFGKQQMLSAKYDGTDVKPILNGISPEGIAVDWISRRIYYVNRAQNTLEVASLENSDTRAVLFKGFNSLQKSLSIHTEANCSG
ncbi:AGAP008193-PA-like protein [Anopheles sinensis]|uniref:AGAP008193-PA-like protein n=1 Tax=Anopheles sinensis TaxID=74873 RepID=A0A084VG92_ANOSI|nr:AGAP008193-PA-like protein [Anopheles sinensis]